MKDWFRLELDGIDGPPAPGEQYAPDEVALVKDFENAYQSSGCPADLALFKGERMRILSRPFVLTPSARNYCADLIAQYNGREIESPEPYQMSHRMAGSEHAFDIWFPWAHPDSLEYPPIVSGTFRRLEPDRLETGPDLTVEERDLIDSGYFSKKDRGDAIALMKSGRFCEALPFFIWATENFPDGYRDWYMAGQCYRFVENYPQAIKYLQEAVRRNPSEKDIYFALGIAFQLANRLDSAVGCLVKSLDIDPNYDLAYNSLALTQMKKGDFEFALHNYDEALKSMVRRVVKDFVNSPKRGIAKYHDSTYVLWSEYAMFGAMFLASSDSSVGALAWPTGEMAIREEREETFEGLFWSDSIDKDGVKTRLFLPNYFNTFRQKLSESNDFPTLLRSKGTALEALGRLDEANAHYAEAEHFFR